LQARLEPTISVDPFILLLSNGKLLAVPSGDCDSNYSHLTRLVI
jgi:hypothetical protein